MCYRIIMVHALVPTAGVIFTTKQQLMYEAKRTDILTKMYTNCMIPVTYGYHLVCM